jgi:hypothetical protein
MSAVARMERSEIRGGFAAEHARMDCGPTYPDFASLHPGYEPKYW